jgi:hypothetical protein
MIINNPISVQGEIVRAQDLAAIKHSEDSRAAITQMDVQKMRDNQEDVRAKQVLKKDDTENEQERHDAKEKGKGQYFGDGGRGRKKQNEGVVLRKGPNNAIIQGFDIKV